MALLTAGPGFPTPGGPGGPDKPGSPAKPSGPTNPEVPCVKVNPDLVNTDVTVEM